MDSKQQTRFMMAAVALGGGAIANQAEQASRKGWNVGRALQIAALAGGALWAARQVESEIGAIGRWVDFYRDRYEAAEARR